MHVADVYIACIDINLNICDYRVQAVS